MRRLTWDDARAAVLGGAVLGGGGGGALSEGLALASLAFEGQESGAPVLAAPEALPGDAVVVTVGLVGSQAGGGLDVSADVLWAAFAELRAARPDVAAVMANESGAAATVNGWYQGARAGLPVLDCPANGRAHPTGQMGSLNLDLVPGYESLQACAGRGGLRLRVQGPLAACARLVRQAAVEAGGSVAVARNPTTVEHAWRQGALGAISQAIELGRSLGVAPAEERIGAVARLLGPGAQAVPCRLREVMLRTEGGFDLGEVILRRDDGEGQVSLFFWNEYVCAEGAGLRAAFPDLIATLDRETGWPLTTAQVAELEQGRPLGLLIEAALGRRLPGPMSDDLVP